MNFSYLDNWWLGTKEKNYADFVKPKEAAKREKMFADIAKAGFKTVRIPIDFGAWANYEKPYKWTNEEGLKTADSFVKWALDNDLNAIIDLHHVEFDGKVKARRRPKESSGCGAKLPNDIKIRIPKKCFLNFETNRTTSKPKIGASKRKRLSKPFAPIAPNHTLIVGFHDWNSRTALIESKPFADKNIIYTFHYYDPFFFTHQGATWAGEGLAELKYVPFPYSKDKKIKRPKRRKENGLKI